MPVVCLLFIPKYLEIIEIHLVNKTSKPILHSHTHHKGSQAQVLHRCAWVKCCLQVPNLDGSAYRQCTYIYTYVGIPCTYVQAVRMVCNSVHTTCTTLVGV